MVTLDEIEADLKRLDPAGILNGVAYSKSFNTRLGVAPYATKPFDFSVFIPWGSWDVYNHRNDSPPPKIPSQFGIAIQQVITAGVKDPSGQVDNKTCFIDLVHLGNPDTTFMTEANGEWPGVVQTLAKYVDQMDPEMTPVIRFLTGSAEREPKPSVATQSSYLDSFWPNGSSVFRHKKAMLYIGYYNPNFKYQAPVSAPDSDGPGGVQDIADWLKALVDKVRNALVKLAEMMGQEAKQLEEKIKAFLAGAQKYLQELVKYVEKNALPSMSWNHAKFVAVNGRTLVTGGANFADKYRNGDQKGFQVWDFAMTISGDASVSCHSYADYIWKYLKDPHPSDERSIAWSTSLSVSRPASFQTLTCCAPLFGRNPTAVTGVPALSIARVGDWRHGARAYPVQIIDAVRDILLQILNGLNEHFLPSLNIVPAAVEALSDPKCVSTLIQIGVTPTAWASRRARLVAIERAETSVHMAMQALVDFFPATDDTWKKLVTWANTKLELAGTKGQLDGKIRPFDMFVAFSKTLARFSKMKAPDPSDPNPSGAAIYIVLSTYGDDYGDWTPVADLIDSLTKIMTAMATFKQLPVDIDPASVKDIIAKRFLVKRLSDQPSKTWGGLHNKTFCVDKELLYIGSDNAYPNYNEEQGLLIDNTAQGAKTWVGEYYNQLWKIAVPPKANEGS